jgi:hypothetical protein
MTQIPTVGSHLGVRLHDRQSDARLKVVRAAINRVASMTDIMELSRFAADVMEPPEARLFAASKVGIQYQLAAEERRLRPIIDLDLVRASVAGLDSVEWRNPTAYGSDLQPDGVPRECPLDDSE